MLVDIIKNSPMFLIIAKTKRSDFNYSSDFNSNVNIEERQQKCQKSEIPTRSQDPRKRSLMLPEKQSYVSNKVGKYRKERIQ